MGKKGSTTLLRDLRHRVQQPGQKPIQLAGQGPPEGFSSTALPEGQRWGERRDYFFDVEPSRSDVENNTINCKASFGLPPSSIYHTQPAFN